MNNPLLGSYTLPPFNLIKAEHIEPAIDHLLAATRLTIAKLLANSRPYTWATFIVPLETAQDRLTRAWSPAQHLNAVANSDELRAAYNACLPKLSEYATEIGQHKGLFGAYQVIANSDAYATLAASQQKTIVNALRDFRLSGIDLAKDKRQRYKEISQQLTQLTSRYEENVLDATHAWSKLLNTPQDLAGLPKTALNLAKQTADKRQQEGWLLTLEFPVYRSIMTYADKRELRQEIYTAFSTRASEQNSNAKKWDNSSIMEQILQLRHEEAQLLGFANYAELSLATKMANSPQQVIDFLEELAEKSKIQAQQDLDELRTFARKHFNINELQAWDLDYYTEKMRQHCFQLSIETLKCYFPITRVLPGLFAVVEKLYGIKVTAQTDFSSWHEDVQFFHIHDRCGQLRGKFYLDLYARPKKRGGAWMDDCVGRRHEGEHIQTPVAYLNCNFTPPVGDAPALLTHDDVATLFHEFGHGLQHILTQVDHLSVAGINGVPWDAVEFPSQFMENWCWTCAGLALISGHYQTGAALPDTLFEKMWAAKNFQSAMAMVRQLEFSLFDFYIHLQYAPSQGGRIYQILKQVRAQVAVFIPPDFNRFAHSFAHIFAGGYAAGYYSYKWAEVLSSDAFSLFEERGIFDQQTGRSFLQTILEQGGTQEPMDLFVEFRGRKPKINALLRHSGIGK